MRRSRYNRNYRIGLFEMLWTRKIYYLLGFILAIIISIINKLLGNDDAIEMYITISISSSFIFGHLIYMIIEEGESVRKDRNSIVTREGFMSLLLSLLTIIILVIFL